VKTKDEFASRSRKCFFVSYPFGKKGWKVFDLDTHEIFISRDVVFHENIFPFQSQGKDKEIVKNDRTFGNAAA